MTYTITLLSKPGGNVSRFVGFTEPLLRFPRALRTIWDVNTFDQQIGDRVAADGQANWRMRSAMDIHPRAGRTLSKIGVRHSRGGIPTLSQAQTSTFVDVSEIPSCVTALQKDGVYVFENLLPSDMVARMLQSALAAPAQARGLDAPAAPFPRSNPVVGRYDINEENTMACVDMQNYCSDPALALIAARYLKQPVIQDQTALWWTTTQGAPDSSLNAWLFHQDRDRLSFVKFFVYLTDVGPENGPHTFVCGTHKKVPRMLATDGRKDDDLVKAAGLWERVLEQTGKAGTLMAVDTVGLHKGKPPKIGDRCVLQVEFATSLFGAIPDYPQFNPSDLSIERYREMPEVLQRWKQVMSTE